MKRASGFQIIEVMLFLGISGLLLGVAMTAFSSSINNSRIADSRNTLSNFFSEQYNDVRQSLLRRSDGTDTYACTAGAIPTATTGDANPGASNDCIVLGKLLVLSSSGEFGSALTDINTFTIIGNRCPQLAVPSERGCTSVSSGACNASPSPAGAVGSYCPAAVTSSAAATEDFTIPWGGHLPVAGTTAAINPAYSNTSSGWQSFNRIAIIRSPLSERTYTYYFSKPSSTDTSILATDLTANNADRAAIFCLQSSEALASNHFVRFSGGQGAAQIENGQADGTTEGALACS